jgi:mitogen-activated protein kinase kinase kinase
MPRSGNSKHMPVLYPHPEIGDGEGQTPVDGNVRAEYPRQHSIPGAPPPNKSRIKLRTVNSYPLGPIPTPPPSSVGSLASDDIAAAGPPRRAEDVYSRFTRKYRPGPAEHDPDTNYFQRGLGQLNDPEDSNDESSAPPGIASSTNAAIPHGQPVPQYSHEVERLSLAERERLEWQTMLAFVLDGDVFRSEKTRIVRALETVEARNNARQNIWLGIRAWLRGRTDSEELQRLEFRRTRVVGAIYDEVMSFRAVTEPDPRIGLAPEEPIIQVQAILERYDTACSLYPSLRAMREDKPACASPEFLNRIESLISWGKSYVSLQRQVGTLQFWVGSETIDFTPPNASKGSSEGREGLDGFMERILKEDSLQRTFERGALVVINTLIESTRHVIATRFDTFQELNLPSFEHDLILLISFPTKLMEASLRIRLDAASRVKDPNMMVLDTLTDDFRLAIALACTLKREYEVLIAEDVEGHWKLPPCIPKGYDSVLLQSLLLFFKLLHWKLKSGAKGIHFKETEVLDAQEDIMDEVSMTIEGGAALIAEQLW